MRQYTPVLHTNGILITTGSNQILSKINLGHSNIKHVKAQPEIE